MQREMIASSLKAGMSTVIMLTIVDDKNLAYGLGATDYMIKPVDRERLAEILMKFRHVPAPRFALVIDTTLRLDSAGEAG